MKGEEVLAILRQAAPEHYACAWDNVGLLVGSSKKEVKRIYLALDATDEVVEQAVSCGADLLVTHHPLIFSGLKRVTDEDFIGRRVQKLIAHDISYYAMHTSFDVSKMADLAAERLGFVAPQSLEEMFEEDGETKGIGKIGNLAQEMTLASCAQFVKKAFEIPAVKVFGNPKQKVKRAAVCPGSGKSEIPFALQKGAEVLITGDIDHHDGIDAVAQGLCVIDAGHYGLEHIFVPYMKEYLDTRCRQVEVIMREDIFPFEVV